MGVSETHHTKGPCASFTRDMIARYKDCSTDHIEDACFEVAKALEEHRRFRLCHCDFEYLRTGSTDQETGRLRTLWTHAGAGVVMFMGLHDEICCCGCFAFQGDEKKSEDLISLDDDSDLESREWM